MKYNNSLKFKNYTQKFKIFIRYELKINEKKYKINLFKPSKKKRIQAHMYKNM